MAGAIGPAVATGAVGMITSPEQADHMVDLAGRRCFENRENDLLIRQKRCNFRLLVISRDQDRAEAIFPDVDQARVQDELAFHLMAVSLFDRVEEADTHDSLWSACEGIPKE